MNKFHQWGAGGARSSHAAIQVNAFERGIPLYISYAYALGRGAASATRTPLEKFVQTLKLEKCITFVTFGVEKPDWSRWKAYEIYFSMVLRKNDIELKIRVEK